MYLVEVPVEAGGRLLVEASEGLLPDSLELAGALPGEVLTRARESLERSLEDLTPALTALGKRLQTLHPEEFTVQFGLILGAAAGAVVAKGSAEMHFAVTMRWGGRSSREESPVLAEESPVLNDA